MQHERDIYEFLKQLLEDQLQRYHKKRQLRIQQEINNLKIKNK